MGLRIIPILSNKSVRFTRADALLEKGMIVCVHCGSKYSKLLERCPNPECPSREHEREREPGIEEILKSKKP